MRPLLQKIDFRNLTDREIKRICSCENKCVGGLSLTTHNDGMILCDHDARQHMYEMIKHLDSDSRTKWIDADVNYLINHYKQHGVYRGINNDIASALGKTYIQVKSKARKLQLKGILKKGKLKV